MDRSSEIFVCRQVLHRTTCWGEICKAKSTLVDCQRSKEGRYRCDSITVLVCRWGAVRLPSAGEGGEITQLHACTLANGKYDGARFVPLPPLGIDKGYHMDLCIPSS
jgi:hypothetical protein